MISASACWRKIAERLAYGDDLRKEKKATSASVYCFILNFNDVRPESFIRQPRRQQKLCDVVVGLKFALVIWGASVCVIHSQLKTVASAWRRFGKQSAQLSSYGRLQSWATFRFFVMGNILGQVSATQWNRLGGSPPVTRCTKHERDTLKYGTPGLDGTLERANGEGSIWWRSLVVQESCSMLSQ